jgi:hypothetical protein
MSPNLWPSWLRTWIQYQLIPALGLEPQQLVLGTMRGMFDTLLLLLLGVGFLNAGRYYMDSQFTLPRTTQAAVIKWAPVADYVARQTDIPREVPLVLWFKESSMQAMNPDNCIGIMGAYDLVRSGEYPCFTPGPISDIEVSRQLAIGAVEFKKRCPDITYRTHDPEHIKRCYLAYNAGTGAAQRLDPTESAYVMNNYNTDYQNMIYRDIELGTVRMTALGAWPAHLAMNSLIVSQLDTAEPNRSLALVDVSTRIFDGALYRIRNWRDTSWRDAPTGTEVNMTFPRGRTAPDDADCLGNPHLFGRLSLRPSLNPVTESPVLTQHVHGCSYNLPGLDISSSNSLAVLQAPMPGEVTTFTDRWHNSTIRIENEDWIVWLLHPRSYLVREGEVRRGQPVGIMGAVGFATGPHVHYTIYDKVNETFVNPSLFIP